MKCLKCSYERQAADSAPAWQCPSCKVAYVKALQSKDATKASKGVERDQGQPPSTQTHMEPEDAAAQERQWLAARGQKIVIYSILLNFFLRAVDRSHVFSALIINALYFCTAVYSLLGVVKICSSTGKTQNSKILFMVLSFFPVINLIALVYLNLKTTRMLRDAGWEVGLLGART